MNFALQSNENEVHDPNIYQKLTKLTNSTISVTRASRNDAKKGHNSAHQCGAKWIWVKYTLRNHHAEFHACHQF